MAVLSVLAVLAGGCGAAQRDLISRALKQPIKDAQMSFALSVTQAGGDLVTATVDGPFHSTGPNRIPSFDFNIDVGLHIAGSTRGATFRAISTGDDVFVRYEGVDYEVGKAAVARYMRHARRQAAKLGDPQTLSDFQRLGLKLDSWFPDSQIVGEETLNGERVTHLHGRIDVGALIGDFAKLMTRNDLRDAAGRRPGAEVTPAMIHQIEKIITHPTYDVFVDKASGGFRRIAAQMGIDVPGGPALGMNMHFDWTEVGQHHEINAPASGRPISELGDVLSRKFGVDLGAAMSAPAG